MKKSHGLAALLLTTALCVTGAEAAVVGHLEPAVPMDAKRVAALPAAQQAAWVAYVTRSEQQMAADKAVLAAERAGLAAIPPALKSDEGNKVMALNKPADWYGSAEARHIADVIVSFQIPSGGWGKNAARDGALRQKGQTYIIGDGVQTDPNWSYVGTFDNGATITEIRFLAKVAAQTPGAAGEAYRTSALRGIAYALNAQYPNGGWPQVWPLEGGYHDGVTFNDDAFTHVIALLHDAGTGQGEFAFIPEALRAQAKAAEARGEACILASQVRIDGKLTVWGQQHDPVTLAPTAARNYEMASLSSAESAGLLVYLMSIDKPSPEIVASIKAGVAWLRAHALHDVTWAANAKDRKIEPKPGAPLLWSRYYSLATGQPIFGDRDKSVHDDVMDISAERRNGYSWYNSTPQKALDAYDKWIKAHPEAAN
jgi:PelA/Pel-15E family pectate lyase